MHGTTPQMQPPPPPVATLEHKLTRWHNFDLQENDESMALMRWLV
jgi:hypothetical protein